ncbi:MAG: hypothetical protein ACFNX0_03295 [Treponema sp.]
MNIFLRLISRTMPVCDLKQWQATGQSIRLYYKKSSNKFSPQEFSLRENVFSVH